jgi:hypothetical protein
MNRHERRKAAARAKRAGVTRETALAVLRAVLSPALASELDEAPHDVTAELVDLLAGGHCTVAEAAEAWGRALDLWEARERGELDDAEGCALMAQLARRHRDEVSAN